MKRVVGTVALIAVAAVLAFGTSSAVAQRPVVTIVADGPATARPGETVSYQFRYAIEGGPGTGIAATWHGERIAYASQRVVSGEGRVVGEPAVGDTAGVVNWSLPEGTGIVELTLQIPADLTSGTVSVGGYEPGTGTTRSNTVTTVITPAAPPITGSGSVASDSHVIPVSLIALLVAAGIIGLATAARMATARRIR